MKVAQKNPSVIAGSEIKTAKDATIDDRKLTIKDILTRRSGQAVYEQIAKSDKLLDAYKFFLLPSPIYLNTEMGIAYIVHSLLVNGDSYAHKLMEDLAETETLRISDTVITKALDILVGSGMVKTYDQKAQGREAGDGRGRPRNMMAVSMDYIYAAYELLEYWEDFLHSPGIARSFVTGESFDHRTTNSVRKGG
jgi:hypothetical protein